jgi:uncharacterized protein YdeI (YjbR/CyaY-like superfamily)
MNSKPDLPILPFATQEAFRKWLHANHASSPGIWLQIAKKDTGVATVSYAEAIDVVLCYGWIDGQLKTFDKTYYLQRFTPRRAKSIWSKINTQKVAQLIADGKMQPAGLAAVEAAKKDGRWDAAYEGSSTMTEAADFLAALNKNPKAKAFYATLNKTNTYAINWRIHTAKTPEKRKAKIEQLIAMLSAGQKLH